ncbi:MAG TPA: antitoxin Xre/MbcA/ParS toxin-binding domain-containing protein [Gemmatimonadaceae bacterium]|nr:antitoxin Xre/MbcA/ParS toxin-binding domain-containing protein [Gemmatimonadaceae bacterium]
MSRAALAIEYAEKTVEWAREELELTSEEIATVVGADRKTIARWRDGRSAPSAEHRRHLERLNQLRFLLESSFRSPDAAQRWLQSPAPVLKGKTPLFALTEGDLDSVLKLLGTLAAGGHR